MMKTYTNSVLYCLVLFFLTGYPLMAQTTKVSGTVTDGGTGETLAGVNIVVKGKVIGTITNFNGEFELSVNSAPPLTIQASFIGFNTSEIEITDAVKTGIKIDLEEAAFLGQEIVVSASRVEESILESPVSIEKMGILAIQNSASDDYYKSIANLKGVDMAQSSVNFQIINARGFNSTGNTRFVQQIDGMDTQAPGLNFPIGNLNGPSQLDVESVELIPGPASALYGPNAFNGILLINSKSPFDYQGISAYSKVGINHMNDSDLNTEGAGEVGPGGSQTMYDFGIRYAKSFNNKFAFKVNFAYNQAEDWYGTDFRDKNDNLKPAGFGHNPGANQVHKFGDEVSTNLALVGLSPSFASAMQAAGLGGYLGDLPNQSVSRTGYEEEYLVDYNAKNLKGNVGLHYRPTDLLEVSYNLNYGSGTTVYTGAQRYSVKNFNIVQHKVELEGDNFFLRGYTTIEDSGDSYIADLTGVLINEAWKDNSSWFGDYAGNYLGFLAGSGIAPGTSTTAQQEAAHLFARAQADVGRFAPGSAEFEAAKTAANSDVIPSGSKFDDATKFYHVEGQYDFKNQIDFVGLQMGASYKLYDLGSNGTIFADTVGNDITIQELGAYLQASKWVFDDNLKLTGSLRWDKNENFDSQLTPRISAVYKVAENHRIRASYQTGFRNPTTQGQHIDLNVISARLIGGLPQYAEAYNMYENAYTAQSVEAYIEALSVKLDDPTYVAALGGQSNAALALGDPTSIALLVPATQFKPVQPEEITSMELGYKAQIGNNLYIDAAYFRNIYNNFIAQVQVRKAAGLIDQTATTITEQNVRNAQTLLTPSSNPENTFQTYTNVNNEISSQGFVIGVDYSLPKGYKLSSSYNWNKLNEQLGDGFLNEFNTPESKINASFSNRKVTDNFGFNVTFRWQDAFRWEASFGQGDVPAFSTVDAQVSYRVESIKSVVKLGASNLLNERYGMSFGGPTIGSIYYLSLTFDEFFN